MDERKKAIDKAWRGMEAVERAQKKMDAVLQKNNNNGDRYEVKLEHRRFMGAVSRMKKANYALFCLEQSMGQGYTDIVGLWYSRPK